jgi:hypothetical protein
MGTKQKSAMLSFFSAPRDEVGVGRGGCERGLVSQKDRELGAKEATSVPTACILVCMG